MTNCGILHIKTAFIILKPTSNPRVLFKPLKISLRDFTNEAILKFLMTYRCTPHSGTEFALFYLKGSSKIFEIFFIIGPILLKFSHNM